MLDIKFIRENAEKVQTAALQKRLDLNVNELLALDKKVTSLKTAVQAAQEEKNRLTNEIKKATNETRPALIEKSKEEGAKIAEMTAELKPLEDQLYTMMLSTPTIPKEGTPIGKDESENVVIRQVGTPPKFDFEPKDHVELLESKGLLETNRITKISGTRTVGLKGVMVQYELAVHQYVLNKLASKGFTPISVPVLCDERALLGTGHFPADPDSVYEIPKDNQYLIGTAEVILNSLHRDELLTENDLPIMYAGFSPCLRREAGATGRDTRGLIRVHQFNKTEQYVLMRDNLEEMEKMHYFLLNNTEEILQDFELPYQIIQNCTGDMGMGKYMMHDAEVWVPSEGKYRETHSCSSLVDWQARRTNLRYRGNDGKVHYCYTLNNTGIASPRIFVGLLENHQQADGSIRIPKALQPYMMGMTEIK